jgi:hypothetical protein
LDQGPTGRRESPNEARFERELSCGMAVNPQAQAFAEKALRSVVLDPTSALAQDRLGQVHLENGKARMPSHIWWIALADTPDDRATLYSLARALRRDGR